LFFKWIKQNLRVKTFYGTSSNAVKTQIWIAMIVYLLLAILNSHSAPFFLVFGVISDRTSGGST